MRLVWSKAPSGTGGELDSCDRTRRERPRSIDPSGFWDPVFRPFEHPWLESSEWDALGAGVTEGRLQTGTLQRSWFQGR